MLAWLIKHLNQILSQPFCTALAAQRAKKTKPFPILHCGQFPAVEPASGGGGVSLQVHYCSVAIPVLADGWPFESRAWWTFSDKCFMKKCRFVKPEMSQKASWDLANFCWITGKIPLEPCLVPCQVAWWTAGDLRPSSYKHVSLSLQLSVPASIFCFQHTMCQRISSS